MGHETKLYIRHNFQTKNMWTHTSNSHYTFVVGYAVISTHSHTYKYLGGLPVLFTNTPMISCATNRKRHAVGGGQFYFWNRNIGMNRCTWAAAVRLKGARAWAASLYPPVSPYFPPSAILFHQYFICTQISYFYNDDYRDTVCRFDIYNLSLCYALSYGPHLQPFTQTDTTQSGKMILHPGNWGSTFLRIASMYTAQNLASLLRKRWF